MKHIYLFILLTIGITITASAQFELYWADEFDGSTLNTDNWEPMIGNGTAYGAPAGWGNNELQYYTDNSTNVKINGGSLEITTKKQSMGGYEYTSARIRTIDKVDFKYGKAEARIKIPWLADNTGGLLPAFWMLPSKNMYGDWPTSGEIDIMESFGYHKNEARSSVHYGTAYNIKGAGGGQFVTTPDWVELNWYYFIYTIEWDENNIRFYIEVDDANASADNYYLNRTEYGHITRQSVIDGGWIWPCDQDFHLLLNVAVDDGNGTGDPWDTGVIDPNFTSSKMSVDWVRVYQYANDINITGPDKVLSSDDIITFSIPSSSKSNFSWGVPAGATIASGDGTNEITVDFSNASTGNVTLSYTNSNSTTTNLTKYVTVIADECTITYVDYDGTQHTTYTGMTTGILTENFNNPSSGGTNTSSKCAKYVKSSSTSDNITFLTDIIPNATKFIQRNRTFQMDVYSPSVSIGTPIYIQLSNNTKSGGNGDAGTNSIYVANTTTNTEWETLDFTLLSQPDASVTVYDLDQIVILFDKGSSSTSTFYFDNLKSLCNNNSYADFTFDDPSPQLNETITFTDQSTGSISSYSWDFGTDASPATATGVGPHSVTYSTSGHKTVSLDINSGADIKAITNCIYIKETTCLEDFDDGTVKWLSGSTSYKSTEKYGLWELAINSHGEWDNIKYEINDGTSSKLVDWTASGVTANLQMRAKATDTVSLSCAFVDEIGLEGWNHWISHNTFEITTEWQYFSLNYENPNLMYDEDGLDPGAADDYDWDPLSYLKYMKFAANPGYQSFPDTNSFDKPISQFNGTIYIDFIEISNALCYNSISETEQNLDMQILPNPFNNNTQVIINSINNEKLDISVFGLSGQQVEFASGNTNEVITIGSKLKSGVYILNAKTTKGISRYKLIKQ